MIMNNTNIENEAKKFYDSYSEYIKTPEQQKELEEATKMYISMKTFGIGPERINMLIDICDKKFIEDKQIKRAA